MHEQMSNTGDSSVAYRTVNLYPPGRFNTLWFFADPPHSIKTTRNCVAHSGMSLYLI